MKYYERPIDLFSAIFEVSDSSSDEEKPDDPNIKISNDSFKNNQNNNGLNQKFGHKNNNKDDNILHIQNKISFIINNEQENVTKKRKSKFTHNIPGTDIISETSQTMSTIELEELLKKIKKQRRAMHKKK